ncbi:MAG: cytochrome b/b6 domain-containing protein [Candidatus Faecivicinus sp.]
MKHKTLLKLLIDLAMCIVYLMLMFVDGVGGFFHEAAGIGIAALFIIHILLNRSMTKGLIASVRAGSGGIRKRLLLASDLILFIGMPLVILTGILIAKELFMLPIGLPWKLIFLLHKYASYGCLAALCLHVLMHARYLISVVRKLPSMEKKELCAALCRFGAGAAVSVALYLALVLCIPSGNKTALPLPSAPAAGSQAAEDVRSEEALTNEIPFALESEDESGQQSLEEIPTLEEYLQGLRCTGCGRQCSLSSPNCKKGRMQAERAAEEYASMYNSEIN